MLSPTGCTGAPRIYADLHDVGGGVSLKKVAGLMRAEGKLLHSRQRMNTTACQDARPISPITAL